MLQRKLKYAFISNYFFYEICAVYEVKVKVEGHLRTGHEGPDRE
jgi:hypothetical protein